MPALERIDAPTPTPGIRRLKPPAAALIDEAEAVTRASGHTPALATSLVLAAWRGQETRTLELADACVQDTPAHGTGGAIALAAYAKAILYNGLGRYPAALTAARCACEHEDLGTYAWAVGELIEACARSGDPAAAAAALRRLDGRAVGAATEWERGIRAQSAALVGADAEARFREALDGFRRSRTTLQLARAQLLYGEWLRREGRRVDARMQLRAALETFDRNAAAGFAERARRELLATGETVRKRTAETRDDLTAQEAEVARLAADGQTNPEIGAALFLSPRTVEWHLRKVFRKLRVSSRRELRLALRRGGRSAMSA
jgi:DNA-binding CsgD family transcriptional regulator